MLLYYVSDDCFSEFGVCIVLVWRMFCLMFARVVRANFVVDEYFKDIARFFEMLLDEVLIDFYFNLNVFMFIYEDMCDLFLLFWF